MKVYADTIEKILSNDVILVDKNKLENKFEEQPLELKRNCLIVQKDFFLRSQLQLSILDYEKVDKKDIKDYTNKMLTNKLLDYFVSEVGVEKDKSE